MRFFYAAISFSFLAAQLAAQTTTFVVTADIQGAGPVYQNPTGTWRIEFLPAGPQTVIVPSDRFAYLNFGTLRVTRVGATIPRDISVQFLIAQQGTAQIGRYTGEILTSFHPDPRFRVRIRFNNLAPVTLDGVHYSTVENEVSLLPDSDDISVFDVPVRAQLTRGGFVWNQDQVTVDLDGSANKQKGFPISLPVGTSPAPTQIFDSVFTTGSPTEGAIWFGTGYPGGSFTATFQAPGVPPRTIPVLVRLVTPSVGFFTSPDELTFRYQKGDLNPPTQFLTLRTTGAGIGAFPITASLYDGNWITINPIPTLAPGTSIPIAVIPNMTNKNAGFHNTTIVFNWGFQSRQVRVNFEVYDLPGSLNLTSSGHGTITVTPNLPAYPNGTLVRLTATPDRYHRFAGWTGSIPTLRNPQEFIVNGPMSFEAQFPFAGQDVSCVPKLSPNLISAPPEGDTGRIDLQIDRTCPWTVSNLPLWLRVNTTSTPTDSTQFFSYAIEPNPGTTARSTTIQVAGVSLLVEQAPPACAAIRAFSPPVLPFTSSVFFNFLRTRPEGCPDLPIASSTWLSTNSYQANSNLTPRTAMLYTGGSRVPVIQQGLWMPTPYADVPFNHDAIAFV
ncbi:MAG: BACON domain-containing protein, partial [Bryobacterales bacterium]|nr:BACON domain-containing protein [Bryobacterales bacterium]